VVACHRSAWPSPRGRYLSFAEREEIAILKAKDCGVREIARRLSHRHRALVDEATVIVARVLHRAPPVTPPRVAANAC
jgi:Helix-turn-helix domain